MDGNLAQTLGVGVAAVAVATLALIVLLRRDLFPAAGRGLDGGGRLFLGAAFGSGILAAAIKLAVVAAMAVFPAQTIAPLIPPSPAREAYPVYAAPGDGEAPHRYVWQTLPASVPHPADNPPNAAKIALGDRLFHDPALSRDRTVACASCHDVFAGAGIDGRATAIGITGVPGARNAPTVWNAAFQTRLFWDGRAGSLEEQAFGPPLNPDEMGMPSVAAIEERIAGEPGYPAAFAAAFGDDGPITMTRIAQAIATYERTLVSDDSPYDRFVRGDTAALTARQQRGMWLFQNAGCVNCHAGPNFSGGAIGGIGRPFARLMASRSAIARAYGLDRDKGRAPADAEDGIWRIPSLRNVALTAPYFHNGAVTELKEAVRVMATAQLNALLTDDAAQRQTPQWSAQDGTMTGIDRVTLSDRDIDDIAAFLDALSSDRLKRRSAATTGPGAAAAAR